MTQRPAPKSGQSASDCGRQAPLLQGDVLSTTTTQPSHDTSEQPEPLGRSAAPDPTGPRFARRRQPTPTAVLLIASFGAFLAFLDSTIVNIAFPDIQATFPDSSISSLSWVLNAYNIVFAAFLVAAGRLADLLGRRRMFVIGVMVFTASSVLCAVAQTVGQLIAYRVVQGVGAAILVPASLALVVEGFDRSRRAHGVAMWGAAAAIASGLGPPIGGALVNVSSWRLAFLVNLPLGLVAIVVARRGLVESRSPGRRRMPDLRGAALLAASLGLLTLGLVQGEDWGWGSALVVGSLPGLGRCAGRFRAVLARPPRAPDRPGAAAPALVRRRQRRDRGRRRRLLRLPAHARPVPQQGLGLLAAPSRVRRCSGSLRGGRRRLGARQGRRQARAPTGRRPGSPHLGGQPALVPRARRHVARLPDRMAARADHLRDRRGRYPARPRRRCAGRPAQGRRLRHGVGGREQRAPARRRHRHRRARHPHRHPDAPDRGGPPAPGLDPRRVLLPGRGPRVGVPRPHRVAARRRRGGRRARRPRAGAAGPTPTEVRRPGRSARRPLRRAAPVQRAVPDPPRAPAPSRRGGDRPRGAGTCSSPATPPTRCTSSAADGCRSCRATRSSPSSAAAACSASWAC